jgi:hypothetical protein
MFHARNRLRRLVPILAAPGGEARAYPRIALSRSTGRHMSLGNAVCLGLLSLKAQAAPQIHESSIGAQRVETGAQQDGRVESRFIGFV